MVWLVVVFTEENAVEVIPKSWYLASEEKCFWPPHGYRRMHLQNAIIHLEPPNKDWSKFDCKLLGQYDNFKIATKKVRKAQSADNLSSSTDTEALGVGCRKIKKPFKILQVHDEVSSDDEGASSTESISSMPTPTPKSKITPPKSGNQMSGDILQFKNDLIMHLTEMDNKWSDMFRSIKLLHLKVDQLTDVVANCQLKQTNTTNTDVDDMIDFAFPIQDIVKLFEFEEACVNEETFVKNMIKQFSRIGGKSILEVTKKILYFCLTNEVGMEYSWEGAKGKKKFKDLNLAALIIKSVRVHHPTATDTEIITIIKAWLVRSKDRLIHKNKQKKGDEVTDK